MATVFHVDVRSCYWLLAETRSINQYPVTPVELQLDQESRGGCTFLILSAIKSYTNTTLMQMADILFLKSHRELAHDLLSAKFPTGCETRTLAHLYLTQLVSAWRYRDTPEISTMRHLCAIWTVLLCMEENKNYTIQLQMVYLMVSLPVLHYHAVGGFGNGLSY